MGSEDYSQESLDDLTPKQRETLDLLLEHKTSKEIARALGISPHTVDQRIDFAKRKLDVQSRGDLAQRYRELVSIYEPMTYEDSRMVRAAIPMEDEGQDEASDYVLQFPPEWTEKRSAPEKDEPYRIVPEIFDGPHGTWVRIGVILALAFAMMLLILGGLAIFSQLSDMLRSG